MKKLRKLKKMWNAPERYGALSAKHSKLIKRSRAQFEKLKAEDTSGFTAADYDSRFIEFNRLNREFATYIRVSGELYSLLCKIPVWLTVIKAMK